MNSKNTNLHYGLILLIGLATISIGHAQVKVVLDSTSMKIGSQTHYQIEVQAQSSDLVVFPKGQTFSPLEMVQEYAVDTLIKEPKLTLIKKYALTQFDSGVYTIPRQKILINTKTLFTDSLSITINDIKVDTTKQKMFDIKPIYQVDKPPSKWWKYLFYIHQILVLAAFVVYLLFLATKSKKRKTKKSKLAPYEAAKKALSELDNAPYLKHKDLKTYYSELTLIIRKYLDEKVYDHALESTTEQLINRLNLLNKANKIKLSPGDIKKIEDILKRADLVKFAKSEPDVSLAQMDRNTIDAEIDQVKQGLPEPNEEEKLRDLAYQEAIRKKKLKQKRVKWAGISALVLGLIFTVFGFIYGFGYVKDTLIGHDSKKLLENRWVNSAYGVPPIYISTPLVLERLPEDSKNKSAEEVSSTQFGNGDFNSKVAVLLKTTIVQKTEANGMPNAPTEDNESEKPPVFEMEKALDQSFQILEQKGASDIITKQEVFTTPNAAEGIKVFGVFNWSNPATEKIEKLNYALFIFISDNVMQQIVITWTVNDTYTQKIADKIIESIELKKLEK